MRAFFEKLGFILGPIYRWLRYASATERHRGFIRAVALLAPILAGVYGRTETGGFGSVYILGSIVLAFLLFGFHPLSRPLLVLLFASRAAASFYITPQAGWFEQFANPSRVWPILIWQTFLKTPGLYLLGMFMLYTYLSPAAVLFRRRRKND